MPRSRCGERKIGATSGLTMRAAVERVRNGESLRSVSSATKVPFGTLRNYVQKVKGIVDLETASLEPNYTVRQIFKPDQEEQLTQYFLKAGRLHYGLSAVRAKQLAYEFANRNSINAPDTWEKNKHAGEDWFYGFMKWHPTLSLRRPEGTSLARATAFNKARVFSNLTDVLHKHSFGPSEIFNCDETGFMTVQNVGKGKVIA